MQASNKYKGENGDIKTALFKVSNMVKVVVMMILLVVLVLMTTMMMWL